MLFALILGLMLVAVMGLAYSVPLRRTIRKEAGQPLAIPGPEVTPYEEAHWDEIYEAHPERELVTS